MAYPFAGFSSFQFRRDEHYLPGSDSGWRVAPSRSQRRALGSNRDSIVTLAIGSLTRRFDCYLEPDRYAALFALVNTTDVLTDWDRPVPDSRAAHLASVSEEERVAVMCADNVRRVKILARVEFISQ